MSYYRTCPDCGAHLDPQEPCDCTGALIGAAMLLTEGAAEQWDPPKSHAPGILEKRSCPARPTPNSSNRPRTTLNQY